MQSSKGIMSPLDPHFEAVGMRAADDYFSATSRIDMSSAMVLVLTEGFSRRCPNGAIVRGFRIMARVIARQRLSQEGI